MSVFLSTNISQGSVATHLRCGGIFCLLLLMCVWQEMVEWSSE